MFFDPEFQEILNNTEYKQSKKSIFQKFIDVLSRVIFPKIKDNSVLKAGIQALTDSLKEKEQKERTKLEESVEKTEEIESQAQKLINETKPKEEKVVNLMGNNLDEKPLLRLKMFDKLKNKKNETTRLDKTNAGEQQDNSSRIYRDKTRRKQALSDRSSIRVFEEGLGTVRLEHSSYSKKHQIQRESERLISIAKNNNLYISQDKWNSYGTKYPKLTREVLILFFLEVSFRRWLRMWDNENRIQS